ncbi:hypothetical protein [Alkalimarinus alittae]|uniref:Uncharacterized protein n=1 Tax=Alkalimarinus alittae TaxID=2961619 RepID=A0ABY6N529_9ALTE|nr:hypothetical protein [Alkalimarinus alittae]UZE97223.1 hypothetical protein NKI27_05595 [Alkalimarinus alittae]
MSSMQEERSQPIVETSLTELAFIFFFILLIFSAWKFTEFDKMLDEKNAAQANLEMQLSDLTSGMKEAAKLAGLEEPFDPAALFKELSIEKGKAESTSKKLMEFESLTKTIEQVGKDSGFEDSSSEELLERIVQLHQDTKGQNLNLRKKITQLGNGLDHPPCWADPITGNIQYLFDVVINEENVHFHPGWPESRHAQAINNRNISSIPGVYNLNKDLWVKSQGLYEESIAAKCRHFVKVYDHADSKRAFKSYLLGIENHFYKFLSRQRYERL